MQTGGEEGMRWQVSGAKFKVIGFRLQAVDAMPHFNRFIFTISMRVSLTLMISNS